jgi:hypothetical protein
MNPKLLLSFTSLYFFAPFIGNLVNKENFWLWEEEKKQVYSYVSLWYINIWFLLLYFAMTLLHLLKGREWTQWVSVIAGIIIIIILLWGTVAIISDKQLITPTSAIKHKDMMAKSFIPVYNVYLRYKLYRFHQPYWRLKESLLRRWLYIVITLLDPTSAGPIIIIVCILIRVTTLIADIDLIPHKLKQRINQIFTNNPEELRAYVEAGWDYLIYKKNYTISLNSNKQDYQKENSLLSKEYATSYIVLIIIVGVLMVRTGKKYISNSSMIFDLIAYALLLSKYIIHLYLQKWPTIPLIHTIVHPIITTFFSSNKKQWSKE